MDTLFGNIADHGKEMQISQKRDEENTPGRKKIKPKTSVQKRNDSVGRRKRVNISTGHDKSDMSSDFTVKRRT